MTSRKNPRFAAALWALAASGLVLSACGGSSADDSSAAEDTSSSASASTAHRLQAPTEAGLRVAYDHSFVITDPATLQQVAPDFKVGALLYAVNRHLTELIKQGADKKEHTDKSFALQPFRAAAEDVEGHNRLTDADPESKVGTVPVIYNTFRNVILKDGTFDPDTGKEPFRLIAVVNRLDLAGDIDRRGGSKLAGADRRWFGEARLVFAVDGTLPDGVTPLPMTVIAEYRLPALKKDPVTGAIVLDTAFDLSQGPVDEADWRNRRQLWAKVWQGLSKSQLGSAAYVSKLQTILAWVTYGVPVFDRNLMKASTSAANHLAIRTGEQVRAGSGANGDQQGELKDEFEYREFYLNDTWMLSTRKLRREPFACAAGSKTLEDRITAEWWDSTSSMAWNYMLGVRNLLEGEITDLKQACNGKLPYGQLDDKDDNDPRNDETQLRAKFARFKPDTVWRQDTTANRLNEAQIHDFALGTCTGCHSAETGTKGFHIAPAAAGQPAVLSAFLTGTGSTVIDPRGKASYSYGELGRRMALVARFASGDTNMVDDTLLSDIECRNIDVPCKPEPGFR